MDIAKTSRLLASQKLCLGTEHWKPEKKTSTLIFFPFPGPKHIGGGKKKKKILHPRKSMSSTSLCSIKRIWKNNALPLAPILFSKTAYLFFIWNVYKKNPKDSHRQTASMGSFLPAEKLEKNWSEDLRIEDVNQEFQLVKLAFYKVPEWQILSKPSSHLLRNHYFFWV